MTFLIIAAGCVPILAVYVWLAIDSDLPRADFHDDDVLTRPTVRRDPSRRVLSRGAGNRPRFLKGERDTP